MIKCRPNLGIGFIRCVVNNNVIVRGVTTHTTDDPKEHLRQSTVDQKDVDNLSKQACEWWKRDGILQGLHALNHLRVPFIRDNLIYNGQVHPENLETPFPLKDLGILDIGCGGGILSEPLARIGGTVTGVDASEELIKIAKDHAESNSEIRHKITYQHSTIEELAPHHLGQFDAVVCSEVIEHVTKKGVFLEHAIDTLKPGGSIFLTTFNKTLLSWLTVIGFAEYVFQVVPAGTHQYDKFIEPLELQRMLERLNCRVKMIHGMIYNPITATWSWNNCQISYAMHAIKEK